MPAIEAYSKALEAQLAHKPQRLAHSKSVAACAADLAVRFGVSRDDAYLAGLLHDWAKAYDYDETITRARERGIDLGVDLELVEPLVHAPLGAYELHERFPELSAEVLQAIERHTVGAADMSHLDKVIYVADVIEPLRPSSRAITELRALAQEASLDELWRACFISGLRYVLASGRYLFPSSIDIYNQLVQNASPGAKERLV